MHGYSIGTSLLSSLRSLVLFWSALLLPTHLLPELAPCRSNGYRRAHESHDLRLGFSNIRLRVEESFNPAIISTLNHLSFGHATNALRTLILHISPVSYGMRQTLRRSCAACAKSKSKCDLRTPQCSRCVKRSTQCIYANEPLTATVALSERQRQRLAMPLRIFEIRNFSSVDPFDSYPPTRLPREHAQRLIHTCMLCLCTFV